MKEGLDPREIRSLESIKNAYFNMLTSSETISIKTLCESANITRPTFYKHYSSINELMDKFSEEMLSDLTSHIAVQQKMAIRDLSSTNLPENMVSLFKHIKNNHSFYEMFLLQNRKTKFAKEFKRIIRSFVEEGIGAAQESGMAVIVPKDILIQYATGAFLEVIISWLADLDRYTPEELTEILLKISISGPYIEDIS
ncbi:TetR-like C-terminal domain-containing protein [Viridibacillus arvi]|uniref:TetR-like C-terminal domain-containing protein n=1 Tax=Viridibacillus arvi TaxID=263475 RepID=UPI003D2D075B